jgi:hypothetical protein
LSLPTQALHCIHHIRLLCQKRVTQVGRPLDVASHPLNHVWKLYQRLDAGIPRLLCHGIRQRFSLEVFVSIHPLLKLDNFKWISRSSESLRQQRIRVQRNRRDE